MLHNLDLSSPTRDWTWVTAMKALNPRHWTTRKLPLEILLKWNTTVLLTYFGIFWTFLHANIKMPYNKNIYASVMSNSVQPHRRQPTNFPRPWDSPGKNTGVGCHFPLQCMKVKSESEVAQSCPTLSDSMDRSPPGSSVHGIFQPRVLEWCHCLLQ